MGLHSWTKKAAAVLAAASLLAVIPGMPQAAVLAAAQASTQAAAQAAAPISSAGSTAGAGLEASSQDASSQNRSSRRTIGEMRAAAEEAKAEAAVVPASFSPVVQTQFGIVRGEKAEQAVRWRGIPYGEARRWQSPMNPAAWSGELVTAAYGPRNMQVSSGKVTGTDTALYLDIYRPDTGEQDLPVLFYIHGGNNQTGGSDEMDGTTLATKLNAIIVSVNHRLGLLGFINLPALKTGNPETDSGNFGLLDMGQALDWTRNNITAFGGDPNNITISGFSAGGRDVMAMMISPYFRGKFQQVISFNGGLTTADPDKSQLVDAKALAPLALADGKAADLAGAEQWLLKPDKEVRQWLYDLPADKLTAAIGGAGIRMAVFPHLFTDGVVLPKEGFAATGYSRVPVILLSGYDEFSLHAGMDPYFAKEWRSGELLNDPELYSQYKFVFDHGSAFYRYFNTSEAAETIYPKLKSPIYTTIIKWGNNEAVTGQQMARLMGSHHGIFLPLLTEKPVLSSKMYPNAFTNQGAKALSADLQRYIGNFITTGDPNKKGIKLPKKQTADGEQKVTYRKVKMTDLPEWKQWSPKGASEFIFDANGSKVILTQSYQHTTYQELIRSLEQDNSLPAAEKQHMIRDIMSGRWWSAQLDKDYGNPDYWPEAVKQAPAETAAAADSASETDAAAAANSAAANPAGAGSAGVMNSVPAQS